MRCASVGASSGAARREVAGRDARRPIMPSPLSHGRHPRRQSSSPVPPPPSPLVAQYEGGPELHKAERTPAKLSKHEAMMARLQKRLNEEVMMRVYVRVRPMSPYDDARAVLVSDSGELPNISPVPGTVNNCESFNSNNGADYS